MNNYYSDKLTSSLLIEPSQITDGDDDSGDTTFKRIVNTGNNDNNIIVREEKRNKEGDKQTTKEPERKSTRKIKDNRRIEFEYEDKRLEKKKRKLDTTIKNNKKQKMYDAANIPGKEYVIEKVLDEFQNEDGTMLYNIRWQGFPKVFDSWLPESSLTNADLILQQFKQQRRRNNHRSGGSVTK